MRKMLMEMKKDLLECLICLVAIYGILFVPLPDAKADASTGKYTWSEKTAPNYVRVTGKAVVKGKPKAGTIKYSKLDKYGRTGRVVGNITYKMVKDSAGWRESFDAGCDPSGWGHNAKAKIQLYNRRTYNGYFWNRSHLLADSLGGRARRDNLITGTRMQNVGANDGKGGMAYTERRTVSWLYAHPKGTAYYAAAPIYQGKELVPRAVVIDVKTSDGSINERVIVYNAAKGYTINYKTGTFKKSSAKTTKSKKKAVKKTTKKKTTKAATTTVSKKATAPSAPVKNTETTVYVTKTGTKYHLSNTCYGLRSAKSITPVTLTDAVSSGHDPCSICAK